MGLGSTREPVAALRLGPGIAPGPTHGLPADGAGRAHAKPGRCLAARQTLVDGSQNAGAKIKGQRLGHAGRPLLQPLPESDQFQLRKPRDSISTQTALARRKTIPQSCPTTYFR